MKAAKLCEAGIPLQVEQAALEGPRAREMRAQIAAHGTPNVASMPQTGSAPVFTALDMMWKKLKIITVGMDDASCLLFVPQLTRWYRDEWLKFDELISRWIGLCHIDQTYRSSTTGPVGRNFITL